MIDMGNVVECSVTFKYHWTPYLSNIDLQPSDTAMENADIPEIKVEKIQKDLKSMNRFNDRALLKLNNEAGDFNSD